MTDALRDVQRLLEHLNPTEKAEVMQRLSRDLGQEYPRIETVPGLCGGRPVIIRTRIPVWLLEQARRQGATDADLLRAYPSLRAEDLAQARAYAGAHPRDMDEQIRENEAS